MSSRPQSLPFRLVAAPAGRSPVHLLRWLLAWLALAAERYRQRRDLAELDPRLLADIGVTPAEARRECAKPFWSARD